MGSNVVHGWNQEAAQKVKVDDPRWESLDLQNGEEFMACSCNVTKKIKTVRLPFNGLRIGAGIQG